MNSQRLKARMRAGTSGAALTIPMELLAGELRLRLTVVPALEIQASGIRGTRVEFRAHSPAGQKQRSLRFLNRDVLTQTCRGQWLTTLTRRYELLVWSDRPDYHKEVECPAGEGFATLAFDVNNPSAWECSVQTGKPPPEFLENPSSVLVECP